VNTNGVPQRDAGSVGTTTLAQDQFRAEDRSARTRLLAAHQLGEDLHGSESDLPRRHGHHCQRRVEQRRRSRIGVTDYGQVAGHVQLSRFRLLENAEREGLVDCEDGCWRLGPARLVRFTKVAEPGQVLVSQATAALLEGEPGAPALRSLGDREIPDFEEPVRVYELA
jgi:hypothetical protein